MKHHQKIEKNITDLDTVLKTSMIPQAYQTDWEGV
jgi:hypothetical protein